MKYALALVAVAGIAGAASAQTQLLFSVSVDGGAFSANASVLPGAHTVTVEVSAVKPGSATAQVGLAGFNFKPQVLGPSAITVGSWSVPQASTAAGGPGVVGTGATGRLAPFAGAGATNLPIVAAIAGGVELRGAAASSAIPISQNPQSLSANGFGNYFNASDSPVVFRFTFSFSGVNGDVFGVNVPLANVTSQPKWFNNGLSSSVAYATDANNIFGASINVTPTPGTLALLGLGGLVAGRRRR